MTRKTLGASVGLSDMRDDLVSIIGYTGEFSEPNSQPVTAFYTDRYLSPVLDELVKYVERHKRAASRDTQRDIEEAFKRGGGSPWIANLYNIAYQHGVDNTNSKHDRLCTPPIITRKETIVEIIQLLSLLVTPEVDNDDEV